MDARAAASLASLVEMQAQALLLRYLGLDARDRFKRVHAALLNACVGVVRAFSPGAVLEVGAHEARFSRAVKRTMPRLPVIAFEANPDVHATHRERLSREGVDYRNLAVSAQPGQVTFRVPVMRGAEARTMGSLRDFGGHEDYVEHQVEAVTLDSLGAERAFLWIDVEGATGEVLAGAERTLATATGALIEVEEQPRWPGQMVAAEVIEHFAARGYRAFLRDVQRSWQYNVLLLREELSYDPRAGLIRSAFLSEMRAVGGGAPAGASAA